MIHHVAKIEIMRHSAAHILAASVLEMFPEAKFGIGPSIENGFYYDFDLPRTLIPEDLEILEEKMKKIIKQNLPFEKSEVEKQKAVELFKKAKQLYKVELIKELKSKKVRIYKTGNFVDLCEGPHIDSTGEINPKTFKLTKIAGAYWRGSEKNKMLQRIYGVLFKTEKELKEYLKSQEEAEKRDHRKLGSELGLWTFSEYVGAGLPLFTQKGALVRKLINEFIESLQSKQGIMQVWTPQIAKAELFKISGHYEKYKENMFNVHSNYSDEEFFLKPMNCPQHTQIYASKQRSYKDLPIRMADFAMLYRDEKPGELIGLTRTRSFSQDDCHIFCSEDQVEEEMHKALDMTKEIMDAFGFKYKYRLSISDPKHPEKYLGDKKIWDKAEKLCKKIIEKRKIDYFVGVGEAAFYAPKLDLMATDSLGREWQLSTLQIDFFMPERFDLKYIDKDGKEKRPVILHRAIVGSPERLIAILLENYAGALPIWLSPIQVQIIPVSDKFLKYAKSVFENLKKEDIRVELDNKNESVGKKINEAEKQKIPYMLVVGEKEQKAKNVAVRMRRKGDIGKMGIDKFIKKIKVEINNKK